MNLLVCCHGWIFENDVFLDAYKKFCVEFKTIHIVYAMIVSTCYFCELILINEAVTEEDDEVLLEEGGVGEEEELFKLHPKQ